MKANQFLKIEDDEAVSPVIAVILMVAITVVLAATVYVWVSGFGTSNGTPAKSISLTSSGTLGGTYKNYTIASATNGMKYSDLSVTVNGATYTLDSGLASCSTTPYTFTATSRFIPCRGTAIQTGAAVIAAGDTISLFGVSSGQTLRILDTQANSVMLTLVIG